MVKGGAVGGGVEVAAGVALRRPKPVGVGKGALTPGTSRRWPAAILPESASPFASTIAVTSTP
jgi:hypothetical protein